MIYNIKMENLMDFSDRLNQIIISLENVLMVKKKEYLKSMIPKDF